MGPNQNNFGIENRTGRAHPGAEQRPVRCFLMLGMVRSMLSRLCLRQATNGQNTENKEN